jgi:hypothetical protein
MQFLTFVTTLLARSSCNRTGSSKRIGENFYESSY